MYNETQKRVSASRSAIPTIVDRQKLAIGWNSMSFSFLVTVFTQPRFFRRWSAWRVPVAMRSRRTVASGRTAAVLAVPCSESSLPT